MKSIQIEQPGKVSVVERAMPDYGPHDVLLKIHYVGFCGSDLSTFRGLNPLVKYPVIPGHEVGASIAAVGDQVPASFLVGSAVTVNPYTNCGQCASCLRNRGYACAFNETLGVQRDGAMSEYLVVPWEKVILEPELSFQQLAMVEPMSVGFHAVDRGRITDIDVVMVIGCGMIGIGAIIRAVNRGATVIAVDIDEQKLALAKTLGAAHTLHAMAADLHEQLAAITQGRGADVVIEAVGRPETYVMSVTAVAFTGRIVYIGYAKEKIAFETQYFVKKELDILGSRNATNSDFLAVMSYLKKSKDTFPFSQLISAIRVPQTAQQALDNWNAEPGKYFRILIAF